MKEVSASGVRRISEEAADMILDPPGKIGFTQEMFIALSPQKIPIKRGVYRFKSHEEMNRQWDEAMDEMVRSRQREMKKVELKAPRPSLLRRLARILLGTKTR